MKWRKEEKPRILDWKGFQTFSYVLRFLIHSPSRPTCEHLSELPRTEDILNNLLILLQDNLLSHSFKRRPPVFREVAGGKATSEIYLEFLAQSIQKGFYVLILLLAAWTPLLKGPSWTVFQRRRGKVWAAFREGGIPGNHRAGQISVRSWPKGWI